MERGYKRAGRVCKAVPRCSMQTRFKKSRKSAVDVGVGVKWIGIGRNINEAWALHPTRCNLFDWFHRL